MSKFETKELFDFPEMVAKVHELLHDMSGEELAQLYCSLKHNFLEHVVYNEDSIFELTTFTPPVEGEGDHIVINGFYELPNNDIVGICYSDGLRRVVDYVYDGGPRNRATFEEVKSWKRRNDLRDYPNAKDPRLPYVFDLHWDIKHESELENILRRGDLADDFEEIFDEVEKHPRLMEKFKQYLV